MAYPQPIESIAYNHLIHGHNDLGIHTYLIDHSPLGLFGANETNN